MSKADEPPAPPNAPSLPLHIFNQTLGWLVFIFCLPPLLFYHIILHIFPKTRPHPTWSLRRHLAVTLGRLYLACTTYLSLPRPPGKKAWQTDPLVHRLTGKGTKVKMVKVPPIDDSWIVGIAKTGQEIVRPEPVPCFWTFCPSDVWYEGNEQANDGERVIFYVSGGSWVMGHPQSTMFPYQFAKHTQRRVFSVNHRKALSPSTAFPAQLLDLVAGYAYLLNQGYAPENIVMVGDSSGGHLLLALSRYLAELDRSDPKLKVGVPGALLLISPSCDLGHPPFKRSKTDFLVPYLNERAYPSFTRHVASSGVHTSPYFSPAVCGSFAYLACAQKERGQLSVWIQYGTVENLQPDIAKLVKRMEADGVRVDVDLVEGGVHLDAGIAYALGEMGETGSWARLIKAVKRYTA